MEDVITEASPPSRFLEEDLNTFTPPSPPVTPFPSLHFPQHQQQQQPLTPKLLIIALSPISLSLFHPRLLPPSVPLLASLTLPNTNPITLSPLTPNSFLLSVPSSIPSHHSHAIAKTLIAHQIRPDSVLIFDSLYPSNYRGRLPSDEAVAFKLDTSAERKAAEGEMILEGLEYYPSGSVVDGLAAAFLARCQLLNLRASLCVSWPEFDRSVMALIEHLLRNGVLRGCDGLRFGSQVLRFGRKKGRGFESELYT
ncbi:hypothetical protein HN51_069998 [Arachis hypogaea]|uniref:Uncharacterized protein n=1 Tax=Arachis hypogaea TaxID=3818 RepID=A0A444Z3P4_ARAHY|nr:uncharacterized protein LOC107643770 [Arachis ipaensis]XP_025655010.1 uncharacterized protein LOC112750485 [Arachis hypogaea]QHO12338.1 uncharacterized protein DS421_15g506100 [Arachis hypogaea]RYR08811.1 hypothetical protein Ahy_B05g076650 [Arachis hypogaea]